MYLKLYHVLIQIFLDSRCVNIYRIVINMFNYTKSYVIFNVNKDLKNDN